MSEFEHPSSYGFPELQPLIRIHVYNAMEETGSPDVDGDVILQLAGIYGTSLEATEAMVKTAGIEIQKFLIEGHDEVLQIINGELK